MATKPETPKIESERTYIVPLRKEWLKVPEYKRATKAVKALKKFIAKHMKIYDRDLKKVKLDINLNNEIRYKGMKKPPAKIEVKAKKSSDGIVNVELAKLPDPLKFKKTRDEKKSEKIKKKVKEKADERKAIEEKIKPAEEKTEKEAIESSEEESEKKADKEAKEKKHISKDKKVVDQDPIAK